MTRSDLQNLLRASRKRSSLTQQEVSNLVGLKNRIQFARYERCESEPTLRVALACEQLFDVPTAELFAGISRSVEEQTKDRLHQFKSKLLSSPRQSKRLIYKLQWIAGSLDRLRELVST